MKKLFEKTMLAALIAMGGMAHARAQAVVFPQAQQPGSAVATQSGNSYELGNDLFTATFTTESGTLMFGGSEGLHLQGGTELFTITLGDGTTVAASQMTLGDVRLETLTGDPAAVKGSHRLAGHQLVASYTYGNLGLTWRAVLRDGSHYLRTELDITAKADQKMTNIVPMLYNVNSATGGTPAVMGNTRGAVLASDKIFAGLETPMGKNSLTGQAAGFTGYNSWTAASFVDMDDSAVPSGIVGLKTVKKKYSFFGSYGAYGSKITASDVVVSQGKLQFNEKGSYTVTFKYTSGNHRLNVVGVDIVDDNGAVVASDYHSGMTGNDTYANTYTLSVPATGVYTVRYFCETLTESVDSEGTITYSKSVSLPVSGSESTVPMQGLWSRATTLEAGKTWNVSAVVGLIAEGQARRSFLAYSERERAVPWRPFPLYNSWYELNINRKDNANPANNMKTAQATDVLSQWQTQLFGAQGVGVKSFVWDDGWDNYGTWTPHANFSFTEPSSMAKAMGAGTGVWLSPVGGYGTSGDSRRAYWTNKGQVMELSNPEYYQVFWDAASNFVNNYNVNFFKFDGISAQSVAIGPDTDATGEEDAEGIISMERDIRTLKADVFLNTTVGTWASPFWYQFTDATWRQENDYGELGKNSIDRENWITYRDQLVYTHYVKNSPLCPINTLMTHGFILTEYGDVSTNMGYAAVLREMRCAFACGSGMVELYCDYSLMNSINGGALWADLAECIRWQEKNADVLPDIHWVGGNPYDGSKHNIYGWASWNGKKATLALRNGSTSQMTYTTTLREALEIPAYVTGVTITLAKSFSHSQADLSGLPVGTAIDIDQQFTVTLPASSVYVFDGVQTPGSDFGDETVEPEPIIPVDPELSLKAAATTLTVGGTTQLTATTNSDGAVTYTSSNTAVATVSANGVVTAVAAGTATITANVAATELYNAASATATITVNKVNATISLSAAAATLTEGETTQLTATTNSDGAVSYTSSNTAVATVNANGVVTAVAAGTATITASVAATTKYTAASATATITVEAVVVEPVVPVAPEISLSAADATLTEGETTQLTLTTNSDGAVTYKSSNTAVATVDNNGVVTAVAAGTATITANVAATEAYNAASATATITVEAATVVEPEEPETPEIDEALLQAIADAKAVEAYCGVGYPSATAATRTALASTIANAEAGNATASDLATAISAFKNETSDIQMPEEGKTYTFANVAQDGTKRYFKYASSGITAVTDKSQATQFTCEVISSDEYAFVTDGGQYLIWKGPSGSEGFLFWKKTYGYNSNKGYVTSYNSTYCDLVVEKLTADGNVSASSDAELFGLVCIKGWRYSRSEYGYFTLKGSTFDASATPYYNSTYSSAFLIEDTGAAAKARTRDAEDTTAIENTEVPTTQAQPTGIYDLMGRRVTEMQPGRMYIVNGKKTINVER